MGAPENRQAGWDLPKKSALLKAVVDTCGLDRKELWITEMNWALKNTGKYSPVAGRPSVTEKKQADYLVRYYILCLASGFFSRIYWWQLVAPGYGLIDSRGETWTRRTSYLAMKQMIFFIRQSRFLRKIACPGVYLFLFSRKGELFLTGWTHGPAVRIGFSAAVIGLKSLTGESLPFKSGRVLLDESPRYIFFKSGAGPADIRPRPLQRV